ncbi:MULTISPECIES: FAD-dependent oxidoreductase [unclassified Streptomyces]|uniref:FAD-dependent oxidoreductase n=1 Tax=unclassified Streptomyces TaxID=2593676 RepID=UPI003BB57B62
MTENASVQGSYWIESAPGPHFPPLERDVNVDVAVIGAGIAGLSTAWELTRAGLSVAVLEAGRIAEGVTGHTSAKLSALHTLTYERLRRTRGVEATRQYARSQSEAVEHAFEVSELLGIDCELERRDAYTYATESRHLPAVRAEAGAAQAAGLPATFVRDTGLPFPVAGAVRVTGQAQFHPRKYLLGLAEDLRARGALVHEHTSVFGLEEDHACHVTAETGARVTARDVVVATHYPIFDRALLFARLAPRRELVVAAPIDAGSDPDGMYITPEENTRSVRTAPYKDGQRLLIVTGEKFTPGTGDTPQRLERLVGWAEEHFPGIEPAYGWATQDTFPCDTTPLVGHLHPAAEHTYVATGFGGWGLSGGIMAGRLLTALITGREEPAWAGLYDPRRVRSVVREAPRFLKHQADVAYHFVGDRVRRPSVGSVDELRPDSGAVLRTKGGRAAVYRDPDGKLHALSARCTHLGCLVAFNAAERAWECPCHGSRFDTDGRVVQGPATRGLEQRDIS